MFAYGDFQIADHDGLDAVLTGWTGLPGLSVETVDVPGLDGAFFASQSLGQGGFTFDMWARDPNPDGVLFLTQMVAEALAPGGLKSLQLDIAPDWVWWAICSGEVKWQRGLWTPGAQCTLKTQISFQCPDPYGYATPDETANGTTSATIVRALGNMTSFPRVEITGSFIGCHLDIGSWGLDVAGITVASGQKLVLDWQEMDFAVWNTAGTVKVAHAAPGMSRFDRLSLPLGSTAVTVTALSGSVAGVTVAANSRRA